MASSQRKVPAHHGTRSEWMDQILAEGFRSSETGQDWLGHGSYFFEDSPALADEWAEMVHPGHETVVLEAEIHLQHCLDLLDSVGLDLLQPFYEKYIDLVGRRTVAEYKQAESDAYGDFDCSVINWACESLAEDGMRVDVIRAPCRAGVPLYKDPDEELPTSRFNSREHIQLAVRNNCAILGFWHHAAPIRRQGHSAN